MGYTALEKMRKAHLEQFGTDVGPFVPAQTRAVKNGFDLRSAALRFLHQRCEGLRFDAKKTAAEKSPPVDIMRMV